MRAVDSTPGTALDVPVGRLAIQSLNVLVRRERLDLGASRAILAGTSSATAAGQLLQAYSRFSLGDLEAAAAAIRSAINADSNCGLAYHRLSVIQTLQHDDTSALAAVDAGLARGGHLDRQSLGRLKAQRQFVLGYGASAIAAFQDAVLDDNTDIDAWYGLGEALFHFGAFAAHSPVDARAAFDRVAALDSSFAPVYDHLLELALQQGDGRAAERYLRTFAGGRSLAPYAEGARHDSVRSGTGEIGRLEPPWDGGATCTGAGSHLGYAWRTGPCAGRYGCGLPPRGQPDPGRSTQGGSVPSGRLGRTGALDRCGERMEGSCRRRAIRCLDSPGGAGRLPDGRSRETNV